MDTPDTPFVFIASLRRTGSTVLSETLTSWPHSFIFHEPGLGANRFRVLERDLDLLRQQGVDVRRFLRRRRRMAGILRRLGIGHDFMLRAFSQRLLPQLRSVVAQVGVKEVQLDGWRYYVKHFPGVKVVLTGRDPRDIYISIYHRLQSGIGRWSGEWSPVAVAMELDSQFRHQLGLFNSVECLKVRYEDLCVDAVQSFGMVKRFVGSPIPDIGHVGSLIGSIHGRDAEATFHAGQVTDRRVARWRTEAPEIVREAEQVFELMPEYTAFWGYDNFGALRTSQPRDDAAGASDTR